MKKLGMKVVVLALALAAGLALLAGCAGQGTLSDSIDDATGAYTVKADDAGKGSAVGAVGGGIKVAEGQVLVVSPDIQKGSLQLRVVDENGTVLLDEKTSGHALVSHDIAPGDYPFSVTCNEDGTTGTLLIVALDAAEFEKQNRDIDAMMSQMQAQSKSSKTAQ